LFFLKYPVYLIIGLSVFGFISLIQWLYALRMRKKENIKKQISSLQLQNIKRQMDPHFAFNVFNSIGATIRKGEKETAYQAFVKMSVLLRNAFDDSGALFRSLDEELENTRLFVELEQLRFKTKFDFIIKQSDTIDLQWMVPTMIFQNYVENAVKHGLQPLTDRQGILQLELTTDESFLLIFIRDNGPGKTIHYKSQYSTGNGLLLMEKYFALLDDLCNFKIVHDTRVLIDEKQIPCGTEVRLKLPLSFIKKQNSNG
jgi:LytS/YehU family sensor histidine kinase